MVHDLESVSGDGDRVLYQSGGDWYILTHTDGEPKHDHLELGALPAPVEAREEWSQIFQEAWRLTRDYFYDPGLHGNRVALGPPSEKDLADGRRSSQAEPDLETLDQRYRAFLGNITSREQLNLLLQRMLGHLSVSHLGVSGGDYRVHEDIDRIGLLGAGL